MMDNVAALEWVHENIANFGGDPENVTIVGQSGGGSKVMSMMAIPSAQGLFQRVWAMSGTQTSGRTVEEAQEDAAKLIEHLGLQDEEDPVATLKTMNYADLRTACDEIGIRSWGTVNDGEYFLEKEEQKDLKDDFFYIKEKSQDVMLAQLISLCKGRLENFGNYNFFENIQILSPTKKGILGTKELNKKLQEELNPSDDKKNEKKVGDIIFREGDRVMQVKNNYDIYWEKGNTLSLNYETGTGIFNGEIGKIVKIDFINKQIKILFDDEKEAWYAFSDMDQIEHAYAITVHKAQGSEFDVVIVVVTQSSAMLLTRNLLYTGLTRAKKLLILIGNDNVVKFMIQNADTKIRNTGLEYKLKMI